MILAPFDQMDRAVWDRFCMKNTGAWFRHTSAWIEYTLCMRPPGESSNCSFGIIDQGELIAVVPLIKEIIHGKAPLSEFGFAGWNVPYPALADGLGERHRDKAIKAAFAEIDRRAREHGIAYAAFEIHPVLAMRDKNSFSCDPFPFLGFHPTGIATHIIPLDRTEDALLRDMRKGHKSDITAGLANGLVAEVFDRNSITDAAFEIYRQIHFNAAGRQTRRDETWSMMRAWIGHGHAVLTVISSKDEKPIAAALTLVFKDAAYYGSACIEPEHINDRGVMHVLLWETMRRLKSAGIRWYETGWQHTPTVSQEVPGRKEVNIALFKRGFGGMNVPYYRGERFYDTAYMEETYRSRAARWIEEWGRA